MKLDKEWSRYYKREEWDIYWPWKDSNETQSQGQSQRSVESIPLKTGCRLNFLMGFHEEGKMSATIITSKEDIDH